MKHLASVLVVVAVVLAVCHNAWGDGAGTSAIDGRDQTEVWLQRAHAYPAAEKLGRGLSNVLGGWLEIPLTIERRYARTDTFGSLLTGAVLGTLKGVVRTGVGVYETVTFFLPIPPNFAPILPTLESFDKTVPPRPRESLE